MLIINISPNTTTPEHYLATIKRLVLTSFLQNMPKMPHIIFISTTSVLPNQAGLFDETILCKPSPLREIEQWLFAQSTCYDVLRLAGLVGKNCHPVFHLDDVISAIQLLLGFSYRYPDPIQMISSLPTQSR